MNNADNMTPEQREAARICSTLTEDRIFQEFTDNEWCFLFKMKVRLNQFKDAARLSKRQLTDLRKLQRKWENLSAHELTK